MNKNISCDCDAADEEHEHCKGCECVLRWDESEFYCCWCEQIILTEKEVA